MNKAVLEIQRIKWWKQNIEIQTLILEFLKNC